MNNKDTHKKLYLIVFIIFAASVLPIWYIGRYQTMSLDDYYFGTMTHMAWGLTRSLPLVFKAACEQVKFYFYAKQATYSSVFLMSAFPGVWSGKYYWLVPFILSSMIIGSVTALVHTVISDCMGVKDRYLTGIANMILLFVIIQTIPYPLEGIFWYNGAVHYVFMESVLFFEIAIILHGMHSEKRSTLIWTLITASILGFIVGGGNLITGLQACILIGLHILTVICGIFSEKKENSFLSRIGVGKLDKRTYLFFIPEAVTLIGYAVNITAPGNAERQATSVQMNPVMAIIRSFYSCLTHGISWINPMAVVGFVLITVILASILINSAKKFIHPLFLLLISICVLAAMYTPTFYAMSEDAPSRVLNIIYIAEYTMIFINIANTLGYLYSKQDNADEEKGEFFKLLFDLTGNALPKITAVLGIVILLMFVLCADKNQYVTTSAVRSIANGEAARYHAQSVERHEILSDTGNLNPVITAYTDDAKPYLLFKEDVGSNPDGEGYWQNVEMSGYYFKESITVVSP